MPVGIERKRQVAKMNFFIELSDFYKFSLPVYCNSTFLNVVVPSGI